MLIDKIKKWIEPNPKTFPKDTSWILNDDLTPNINNIKHCKEFINLSKVGHSKKWHKEGNALKHSIYVANEMYKLLQEEYCHLSNYDKKVLMIAAICHDLGKATTTYWDEEEQDWKCKNHGTVSSNIIRDLFYDEDIDMREEICWLARHHMTFHHILMKPILTVNEQIKKLSQGRSSIEKLLLLNKADYLGSKSDSNTKEEIINRAFKISSIASTFKCYKTPYRAPRKEKDNFTAYIMIGVPGSGKDTYIHKHFNDLPIICRDDIREEIKYGCVKGNKLMLDQQGEKAVTNTVNNRIKNCCINKVSFVINQTSVKKKYRQEFNELICKHANPNIVYVYIEAPSLDICKERRGNGKWNDIIDRMWDSLEFPDNSECDKIIIEKQTQK